MASVVVELTGDEAKLLRSMERTIQRQEKMIQKFKDIKTSAKQTGRATEQAGKAGEKAFGHGATAMVGRYATKLATIATVVATVTAAFREAEQIIDETLGKVESLAEARRGLNQIAVGATPEQRAQDIQRMQQRVNQLALYGVSRQEATQIKFAARSEGFEGKSVDALAKAVAANVLGTEQAITVAGQVPGLFGGKINATQSINATLAAAKASRANFEQIGGALPTAAMGGSMAGASPAETMALVSVLAGKFDTPQIAARYVRTFGQQVGLSKFKGKGILGTVNELQAMPAEERKKFLRDNKEVNTAYQYIVEQRATIAKRQQEIERAIATTGTDQSEMLQAVRAATSPTTQAGRVNMARMKARQEEVRQEIIREQRFAEGGFETRSAIQRAQTYMESRGNNPVSRYVSGLAMSTARTVGFGENAVETIGKTASLFDWVPYARQAMIGLSQAADKLNRAPLPDTRNQQRAQVAEPTE